ncbi:hypothetical protein LTR86_000355 [Recurvomyces mirabilis]|nr:hypothetical protein LTR86_000355 [Recurvomyces mirabilis]
MVRHTPEREEPVLHPRVPVNHYIKVLPLKIRNMIAAHLHIGRQAILLPYHFDIDSGDPFPDEDGEDTIVPFDMTFKRLNGIFRIEYLPQFAHRVLDMEVDKIQVILVDLDFDILIDFLLKITPAGHTRTRNVQIIVRLVITSDFSDHEVEDRSDTTLHRFLQFRSQTRRNGEHVPLRYHLQHVDATCNSGLYFFLQVFRQYVHPDGAHRDLEEIWAAFEPHFTPLILPGQAEEVEGGEEGMVVVG